MKLIGIIYFPWSFFKFWVLKTSKIFNHCWIYHSIQSQFEESFSLKMRKDSKGILNGWTLVTALYSRISHPDNGNDFDMLETKTLFYWICYFRTIPNSIFINLFLTLLRSHSWPWSIGQHYLNQNKHKRKSASSRTPKKDTNRILHGSSWKSVSRNRWHFCWFIFHLPKSFWKFISHFKPMRYLNNVTTLV